MNGLTTTKQTAQCEMVSFGLEPNYIYLKRSHDSKMVGHFGFVKTLCLVKCQFWWPSLKEDIESYVASCPPCSAAEGQPGKIPGLLQPLAKPRHPGRKFPWTYNGATRKFRKHGDPGGN